MPADQRRSVVEIRLRGTVVEREGGAAREGLAPKEPMIAAQRRTVPIGICAGRRVLTKVQGDVDGGRLTHDARLTVS